MHRKQPVRKPTHPGKILEEHYIKPLRLKLEELAEVLFISKNTLYKIRKGETRITADIAVCLAIAFKTSPDLWLNLQQKYDLWEALKKRPALQKMIKMYSSLEECSTRRRFLM